MDLMHLTAVELGRKIKDKEVTVEEAVTAALDAIEKKEEKVHHFCRSVYFWYFIWDWVFYLNIL